MAPTDQQPLQLDNPWRIIRLNHSWWSSPNGTLVQSHQTITWSHIQSQGCNIRVTTQHKLIIKCSTLSTVILAKEMKLQLKCHWLTRAIQVFQKIWRRRIPWDTTSVISQVEHLMTESMVIWVLMSHQRCRNHMDKQINSSIWARSFITCLMIMPMALLSAPFIGKLLDMSISTPAVQKAVWINFMTVFYIKKRLASTKERQWFRMEAKPEASYQALTMETANTHLRNTKMSQEHAMQESK